MPQFLHIAFNFRDQPKIDELRPTFDKALDWVRYAPNCWIVWTSSSPAKWYARLKPHLEEGDHVFVCAVDLDERAGWLPKLVWDWIRKPRE